jgi:hypothetical protein
MQISNSSTSFNLGQTDFARPSPFAQHGGLSSGGLGDIPSRAAYALGRQAGAAGAEKFGATPPIYSPPDTTSSGVGDTSTGNGDGSNCSSGSCSSGGSSASGGDTKSGGDNMGAQIVQQLMAALMPMLEKALSGAKS